MRRAIKDKLTGILDDPHAANTAQASNSSDGKRQMTDRVMGFVKEKGGQIVSTVQEHASSITDTTGTLAKQKLLQTLFSSGIVQSEHIRQALQIGEKGGRVRLRHSSTTGIENQRDDDVRSKSTAVAYYTVSWTMLFLLVGIGYFLKQQHENPVTSTSYTHREKFPTGGGARTPSHSIPDFDIEAYGLETFSGLMIMFGINPEVLRRHICSGELKEIVNPSSSGSLLYLTSDSTYLVKTVRDYDAKLIQQKFLQGYFQYVQSTPGTFLAKLFGVYGYIPYLSQQRGITVDSFTLRFAIFSNIIPTSVDIHEKYDLKGSSYKRDADFNERMKSSATFKDNDFRDIHPEGLKIPTKIYHHLKRTLTSDSKFLEDLNIMDYSLLLIVHNMDNPVKPKRTGSVEALMGSVRDTLLLGMTELRIQNVAKGNGEPSERSRLKKPNEMLGFAYEEFPTFDVGYAKEVGGIPAINGKGERLLLFLGIIDILQTFDICKVMQRQYQTVENRDVVDERSIVEAGFYAQRFKDFLFKSVFHPADDEIPTANQPHRSSRASLYPDIGYANFALP